MKEGNTYELGLLLCFGMFLGILNSVTCKRWGGFLLCHFFQLEFSNIKFL